MWGLLKRGKTKEEPALDFKEASSQAIDELREKWVEFNSQLKFKPEVPLSEVIESFIVPARECVISKYPVFQTAPNEIIWMLVFNAVMESGTHSKEAVNEAVAELEKKYAV